MSEEVLQMVSVADKIESVGILVVVAYMLWRQVQDKQKLEDAISRIASTLETNTLIYEKQLNIQNELLNKHIEEIAENTRELLHARVKIQRKSHG